MLACARQVIDATLICLRRSPFSGVGCYAWPDGSFFFGSFRYNQSNGLGLFFLPRADDGPVSDWLTADREPFDMYAVVSKQDGVHALWRRKEGEEDGMINGAAGSSSSSSSPPAAAAAAAASSASSAAASSSDGGGDAKLVWQALDRLIKRAVPFVIHLQHERKQATNPSSTLPPPSDHHVSECVRAARAHFSSPALFDLISVPNAVHDLRRKGGCSYLVTGELGCAESPYLCRTCAGDPELQDESATWEMCQGCAEHSSCHAGHSLRALVSTENRLVQTAFALSGRISRCLLPRCVCALVFHSPLVADSCAIAAVAMLSQPLLRPRMHRKRLR